MTQTTPLVLSWGVIGRPPHGVPRQWPVVVRYGMRHTTGASLSSWFLKAAGLSCSTTTAGSWFQSPTVLAANELRSPDEDAPIALNLNRWFALVLLSAATKPIWSGPTATCPVTTLYNKPVWGLADDHSDLANRDHAAYGSHWMSSCDPPWKTSPIAAVFSPVSHNPWLNEGPKLVLHIPKWSGGSCSVLCGDLWCSEDHIHSYTHCTDTVEYLQNLSNRLKLNDSINTI